MRHWLHQAVIPAFAGRILAVDTAVVRRRAALHGPAPKPLRGGLIAATALVHSLVLVTRNLADSAATGVPLLNPLELREASSAHHRLDGRRSGAHGVKRSSVARHGSRARRGIFCDQG